jgi:hypothetical protein
MSSFTRTGSAPSAATARSESADIAMGAEVAIGAVIA